MSRIGNIEVNSPPKGYKASLRSRLLVACVLLAIAIPALIIGSWIFLFAFIPFLGLALIEMMLAPKKKYGWWVWVLNIAITLAYVYWFILKGNLYEMQSNPHYEFSLENYFCNLDISIFGIAVALLIYFSLAIFDKNFTFKDVFYFFGFTIFLGLGFQAFYFLRYFPFYTFGFSNLYRDYRGLALNGVTGPSVIHLDIFKYLTSASLTAYLLLGILFNDVFAYFGGIYFGKHKLIERISPKKTWEGFFFGFIFSFIISFSLGMGLALLGYPILPFLDLEHWYWLLLISLALPLLGDLGDLSMSIVKRNFDLKDFGNVLRGHGGILDRVDSLLVGSIGLAIILVFILHDWNFFI